MRMRMTIEIDADEAIYSFSEDEKLWLENEILVGDGELILHSNTIGDELGVVKSVKNIQYLKSSKP